VNSSNIQTKAFYEDKTRGTRIPGGLDDLAENCLTSGCGSATEETRGDYITESRVSGGRVKQFILACSKLQNRFNLEGVRILLDKCTF
jgi:hypothetical protein